MVQGGGFLQAKLADPAGVAARLAASARPDREAVEELFLRTLGRRPTAAESALVVTAFAAGGGRTRRPRYEDALHALLNHPEVWFNH